MEPSHVLRALGIADDDAYASIRFSLGRFTTEEEIDQAIPIVKAAIEKLRSFRMASGLRLCRRWIPAVARAFRTTQREFLCWRRHGVPCPVLLAARPFVFAVGESTSPKVPDFRGRIVFAKPKVSPQLILP